MAKTILYIVSTLIRTGPVGVLQGIVKHLDPEQYRAIIVTLSPEGNMSCAEEFKKLNIECVRIQLSRWAAVCGGMRTLEDLARSYQADIVHGHGFRPDLIISKAHLKARKVSTLHSVLKDDYVDLFGPILGNCMVYSHYRALRRFDAVACVSTGVKDAADGIGAPCKVILNGVDTQRYHPASSPRERHVAREKIGVAKEKSVLLFAGRLIARKRPVEMIEGFLRSHKSREAVLVLAGEGPLLDNCQTAAAGADNIVFLGARKDVPELLRGADYLLSASSSEGLPMALLEGCASGLRIIASDISAHRQIKEMFPEATTLFPIDKKEGLAEALQAISYTVPPYSFNPNMVHKISAQAMSYSYQELYGSLCDTSLPR